MRERFYDFRLPESWHSLDERMTTREESDDEFSREVRLTYDIFRYFSLEGSEDISCFYEMSIHADILAKMNIFANKKNLTMYVRLNFC